MQQTQEVNEDYIYEKQRRKSLSTFYGKQKQQYVEKQFNNPIYQDLDINEQNRQVQNLGPWIITKQIFTKQSYSINTFNENKTQNKLQHKKSGSLVDLRNNISPQLKIKGKSKSKTQLPKIKQKKAKNQELNNKFRQQEKEKELMSPKNKTKRCYEEKRMLILAVPKHLIKPMEKIQTKNQVSMPIQKRKLSNVVYNYCTDTHIDLWYPDAKKKNEFLETQFLMKFKLAGLRDYWLSRNKSISNQRSTQGSP